MMSTTRNIKRWRAFALLAVAYYMTIIDLTIVNVSLPTIVRSMIVMKYATANSANARQRLILLVVDIIGPPVIWQGASFGRESGEPRAATATARSYLSRRQTVPGLETHRPDRDLPGKPA